MGELCAYELCLNKTLKEKKKKEKLMPQPFSQEISHLSPKTIILFLNTRTCFSVLFLFVLKLFLQHLLSPARLQASGGQDLYFCHLYNP